MATKEAGLWKRLKQNLKWKAATRHEDKLSSGVADVSFATISGAHGWMELKKIDSWPRRDTTLVRIAHFTEDQRHWLDEKGKAGGNTWILVQVDDYLLLYSWRHAFDLGNWTREEMFSHAVWSGVGRKIDWSQLDFVLDVGC